MALPIFQRTVVNDNGDIIPNAQVEVRLESTGVLANLYSDRDAVTPLSNPFFADSNGFINFYASPDEYRIDATSGSFVAEWRHVLLVSASDSTVTVNSISELLTASNLFSVNALNYHADSQGGGGVFYWDANGDKSEHNGGTVIDPDVVYPSDWSNTAQQTTWFTAGTGTGVWRRQYDGAVNVKMFGAKGDGVTDDTKAVLKCEDSYSLLFTKGNYLLSNCELNSLLTFESGSSIEATSGSTVVITNTISSPKQHIFKGDGTYDIKEANGTTELSNGTGENARQIHISWFGSFPNSGTTGIDNAVIIQKALNSVGNVRESVVDFDIGNYNVSSGILVPRGCWIRGSGTRRTVFRLEADTGFDVFTTINQACKFTDIQFEVQYSFISEFDNSYIVIEHNDSEIYNVDCGECKNPIHVKSGIGCRIKNIKYGGSSVFGIGSAVVKISGGSQHSVNGVLNTSSGGNTHSGVVSIGEGASGNISQIEVSGINTVSASKLVYIKADGGSVSNLSISDIKTNSSIAADEMIHIETSGMNTVQDFNIYDINGNAQPSALLKLEQVGTGGIQNGSLSNAKLSGGTGSGIIATKDLGSIDNIVISSTVDVKDRATPFDISGIGGIKIEASAYDNGSPAVTFDTGNLADDSVFIIDTKKQITGQLIVNSLNDFLGRGMFAFRSATSPYLVNITTVGNIGLSTGILTGTTGADAQYNVSVDDTGKIYVENRTGATRRFIVTVLSSSF